jgi:hypothetical protein
MSKFQEELTDLTEQIIGLWDAAEDHGETPLMDALGDLAEIGASLGAENERRMGALVRAVLEGSVAMVIEELMVGEVGAEVLERLKAYRNLED